MKRLSARIGVVRAKDKGSSKSAAAGLLRGGQTREKGKEGKGEEEKEKEKEEEEEIDRRRREGRKRRRKREKERKGERRIEGKGRQVLTDDPGSSSAPVGQVLSRPGSLEPVRLVSVFASIVPSFEAPR